MTALYFLIGVRHSLRDARIALQRAKLSKDGDAQLRDYRGRLFAKSAGPPAINRVVSRMLAAMEIGGPCESASSASSQNPSKTPAKDYPGPVPQASGNSQGPVLKPNRRFGLQSSYRRVLL